MTELTAEHFDTLCRQGPVQTQIDAIEGNRKAAVSQFWLRLGATIVGSIVAGVLLWGINEVVGIIGFIVLLIVGLVWAYAPLDRAREALKLPVLEALAAQGGMTYQPSNFEPPVFSDACRTIFGSWLSNAVFTDLFYGQDSGGSNFAFYEGTLTRRVGKNTQTVFTGQMYALQRSGGTQGLTVILPDRGIFNFFKPSAGMERIHFEDHPEFEKRFEVYSTVPNEARMLLSSPILRDQLLEARGNKWGSALYAFLSPTDALVAISGKNRFEPGSMFRSRPGEERVRLMFDEVCNSLTVMQRLRSAFA